MRALCSYTGAKIKSVQLRETERAGWTCGQDSSPDRAMDTRTNACLPQQSPWTQSRAYTNTNSYGKTLSSTEVCYTWRRHLRNANIKNWKSLISDPTTKQKVLLKTDGQMFGNLFSLGVKFADLNDNV